MGEGAEKEIKERRLENDEDYMKELYERFRDDVMSGKQPDFYDKDELLDIYDYAQDEGDVTTQMFVFLTAARQFPDAEEFLGERMAFFMSYIDNRAGFDMLGREGRKDSALWDVLAIGLNRLPDGDPSDDVRKLLEKYPNFDSEAVIKLIDIIRDLKRLDVIADNYDELKKHAEDPKGFDFEVATAFDNANQNLELAAKIAEGLTLSEPFNVDNWVLLAKLQYKLNNVTESLSAAEYAVALDPEWTPARIILDFCDIRDDEKRPHAIDDLKVILAKNPTDPMALRGLYEGLTLEKRNGEIIALLIDNMKEMPPSPYAAFVELTKYAPDDADFDKACRQFRDYYGDQEEHWINLARDIENEGRPAYAAKVLEHYDNVLGLRKGAEYLISIYYTSGEYARLREFFAKCCHSNSLTFKNENSGEEPMRFSITAFLVYAIASLFEKDYESAEEVCRMMLQNHPEGDDIDSKLRMTGILNVAAQVYNYARHPETIPQDKDFDPLKG